MPKTQVRLTAQNIKIRLLCLLAIKKGPADSLSEDEQILKKIGDAFSSIKQLSCCYFVPYQTFQEGFLLSESVSYCKTHSSTPEWLPSCHFLLAVEVC